MAESDEVNFIPPHPIEIEFFSKQSNKTTKLVGSEENFSVEGAHRWYDFDFIQPVYLSRIEIFSEGYEKWYAFEVEVFHVDQTKHQERISVENNVVSLSLGKLATGFRFRPDTRWSTKTEILRVVATGLTLDEFHQFEWFLKNIQKREKVISDKEAKNSELDEQAEKLSAELNALTSDVGKLTAERGQLLEAIAGHELKIKDRTASIKDIESEIEGLQEERRVLRSNIATDEAELTRLTTKLRLFPSEISGFVEEGNRNIRTYLSLSVPFILILLIVLWSMFSNSIDLTQLWRREVDVDVWTIFLTRIPFVLVAIAMIEACGFVVGRLIFEVVKINRQRLEFAKLSIVAKDVVTASSSGLEMTDEEIYSEELKLKMSLLQEHMRSQGTDEFKYTGSAITGGIIAAASRMLGGSKSG